MIANGNRLVQKLWNYCNVLRDDGLSYQDYIEQLTFLLFLKMADEQTKPPFSKPSLIPARARLAEPARRSTAIELEAHYRHILDELGKRAGDARRRSSARRRTGFRTLPSCSG